MNNLDTRSYSLAEFCKTAKVLLDSDDPASFVSFVLCGRHPNHQVVVDAIQNRLDGEHPIKGLRDFDSLLGIYQDIPVRSSLTLFPLARRDDTLHTNIHLSYSFNIPGHADTVQVHKIPNLCIAKWSLQNMIRVLFPALCADGRSPFLTQEEQRIFYEQGLRPAVVDLLGASAADWPPTYQSEMFRARGHSGHLSFISKVLPEWHVSLLGDKIRENLKKNEVSWGEGLVFLHQIRGVKNSSQHTPLHGDGEVALEEWLDENFLKVEDLLLGNWWVDVGLQISSDREECLAWRTDSHFHVVEKVLQIPEHHADRITSITSTKYTRDITSHLTAVSGCRISPGIRAEGRFSVQYLQLYTTDKSLTYRQDQGHHGKFITCSDILAGKAESYCDSLYNVYLAAMEDNFSLARVEVRIPIGHAKDVLLDLHHRTIRQWLVSFPRVIWWSLRAYRVLAFKYVLEWQTGGPTKYRSTDEALLLTAAGSWLLNGLHSTPDDRLSSRELMTAILPHVNSADADPNALAFPPRTSIGQEEEEEEREEGSESTDSEGSRPPTRPTTASARTLPYNPYGLIFLRTIRVGEKHPVPRFERSTFLQYRALSEKAWKYFFGVARKEIDDKFLSSPVVKGSNPSRIPNKVKRTANRPYSDNTEEAKLFSLTGKGYKLPDPAVDEGSDQGMGSDSDPGHHDSHDDVDSKLSRLWRQFLVDLTAKAPNPKSANSPSYCRLNAEERLTVDDQVHQNSKLSDYWVDCQWKISNENEWTLIFDRLWPKKDKILYGSVQNYKSATYYLQWTALTSESDAQSISAMRAEIRKRFNSLYWVPHAQTDRIWHTKFIPGFRRSNGVDESKPAPRILINWDTRVEPTW